MSRPGIKMRMSGLGLCNRDEKVLTRTAESKALFDLALGTCNRQHVRMGSWLGIFVDSPPYAGVTPG